MDYRTICHNLMGYQIWSGLYITVEYSDFMQSSSDRLQACNYREANCLPFEIFSDQNVSKCTSFLTANLFGLSSSRDIINSTPLAGPQWFKALQVRVSMGQVGHLGCEMFKTWSSTEAQCKESCFWAFTNLKATGVLICWWYQLLHDIFFRIYG